MTLRRWLIENEGWSPEIADQLAGEYAFGGELLTFSESNRGGLIAMPSIDEVAERIATAGVPALFLDSKYTGLLRNGRPSSPRA
jgi:hypothetical protein